MASGCFIPVSRTSAWMPASAAVASRWASIRRATPRRCAAGTTYIRLTSAVTSAPSAVTDDRRHADAVEVADEELPERVLEVAWVDRRLVAAAVAGDVLLLHGLDQQLGVGVRDRESLDARCSDGRAV